MTHAHSKWLYRAILALLVFVCSSMLFRAEYNFAHWVPHGFLRGLGVPYSALLYFEQHADRLLHPLGAFILTLLIYKARLPLVAKSRTTSVLSVLILIILTELIQWRIGRGIEYRDILLGIVGSYTAYLTLHIKKPLISDTRSTPLKLD